METKGSKYDDGKPPISLVPRELIEGAAHAFAYGANKYSAHNFKGGILHSRLVDACLRHLIAMTNGEMIDKESGLPHSHHAAASLGMYMWMVTNRPDLNDLYQSETTADIEPDFVKNLEKRSE